MNNLYIARKGRSSREKGFSWGPTHRQKGARNVWGVEDSIKMRVLKAWAKCSHTNSVGFVTLRLPLQILYM